MLGYLIGAIIGMLLLAVAIMFIAENTNFGWSKRIRKWMWRAFMQKAFIRNVSTVKDSLITYPFTIYLQFSAEEYYVKYPRKQFQQHSIEVINEIHASIIQSRVEDLERYKQFEDTDVENYSTADFILDNHKGLEDPNNWDENGNYIPPIKPL